MLIDISYFVNGPRNIENATLAQAPSLAQISTNKTIERYIKEYQDQFLVSMVGKVLAIQIGNYLKQEEQEDDDMNTLLDKLRIPFADYVFYQIMAGVNTSVFITGCVQLKSANKNISPIDLQCKTWNNMVARNKAFVDWAETSKYDIKIDRNMLSVINVFNL